MEINSSTPSKALPHGCGICEHMIKNNHPYKEHLCNYKKAVQYVCDYCKTPFLKKKRLTHHMSLHHILDTKAAQVSLQVNQNMENSNFIPSKVPHCKMCDHMIKNNYPYIKHSCPYRKTIYGCNLCNAPHRKEAALSRHMSAHRILAIKAAQPLVVFNEWIQNQSLLSEVSPPSCKMCEYFTKFNYPYKQHSDNYKRKILYACDLCDEPFWKRQQFIHHTSSHSNEKQQFLESLFKEKTATEIYTKIRSYALSVEDLKNNGFPLESSTRPGKTEFNDRYKEESTNKNLLICHRCKTEFKISENGKNSSETTCYYHPGKISIENNSKSYTCCGNSANLSSSGCTTAKQHVIKGSFENAKFIKTCKKSCELDCRILALDCEMCYTVEGLEIARVSIVNTDGKIVYDNYILPASPIIDYNTKFSGITSEHMMNITTTLEDVQKYLLELLTVDTILVGHSLENDLVALHLIHPLVVDTSVLFNGKDNNRKYKMSLKNLADIYLGEKIHEDQQGHDSIEDAWSCMQLILLKAYQDLLSPKKRK